MVDFGYVKQVGVNKGVNKRVNGPVNKSVETLFSISRDALASGFFGATRTGG